MGRFLLALLVALNIYVLFTIPQSARYEIGQSIKAIPVFVGDLIEKGFE